MALHIVVCAYMYFSIDYYLFVLSSGSPDSRESVGLWEEGFLA